MNASTVFLQILHKCWFWLKDELIKFWRSYFKVIIHSSIQLESPFKLPNIPHFSNILLFNHSVDSDIFILRSSSTFSSEVNFSISFSISVSIHTAISSRNCNSSSYYYYSVRSLAFNNFNILQPSYNFNISTFSALQGLPWAISTFSKKFIISYFFNVLWKIFRSRPLIHTYSHKLHIHLQLFS